ncbi:hypothetical protein K5D65_15280 [Pseudomonas cichorii]|nr:hypothetical protein [Pseudomonas cichorii]
MSDSKIISILDKLIEKTTRGDTDWIVTEIKGVYQVSFPRYSVRLAFKSEGLDEKYVVTIINGEGLVIDSFNTDDIYRFYPDSYDKLSSLYSAARRKALGVDRALDELLEDMNFDDPLF